MRFGIMAMQVQALVPPALPPDEINTYIQMFDHAAHVRKLAEAGFNPIELGGDLSLFFPHVFQPAAIEALAQLKQELGISYTVHLPLWSVEPSTLQTPVREGSVKATTSIIQATQPLEPEVYVFHATGALAAEFYRMRIPELARGLILRQFQANAISSIQTILSITGLPSRRLAIETIEFPFKMTLEMAEILDLSMCLDTGHILAGFSGPIDFFEAVEQILPRLAEIHLHDSPYIRPDNPPGYGKDHQPLGQGELDLSRFLRCLQQADFQGPLVFELTIEQALESLNQVRKTFPDILKA